MNIDRNNLPDDPEQLKKLLAVINEKYTELESQHSELATQHNKLESEHAYLKEKYKSLQRMLYGKKSEKLTPEDEHQMHLFNELEDGSGDEDETESVKKETTEVRSHTRKKRGRKPLPAHIDREEIIHDLTEADKSCPCCGKERPLIGEVISEELDIIPPKMIVNKHIRKKYGPCNCDGFSEKEIPEIKTAPLPPRLIPQGIASAGLVAYSVTAKFCDAVPFYRQSRIFERLDIELSRATVCNWAMLAAERCKPLIDCMIDEIRGGPIIRMDETSLQVLKEPGRKAESKSYMWVTMGYTAEEKPLLLYQYHPTRSHEVPKGLLENYSGFLQTDGYKAYNLALKDESIKNIIHVGCFAHARRYFENAYKLNKKSKVGFKGLNYIQKIYAVEKKLRQSNLSPEKFIETRRKEVSPILDSFYNWLQSQVDVVAPKSKAGEAIGYTLDEWNKLIRYLDHYLLTPDNNLTENAIRPFVLGRKNWLFSNTPRGAHSSAILYSLIESAKANGFEPYKYLRYIFEKLPCAETNDDFMALLPDRITL
jgi:transposase